MIKINKHGKLISSSRFIDSALSVICFLIGHKYKTTRRISNNIAELKCARCGKEFAIHTHVKTLLPLDHDLITLHNDILLRKP